MIRFRVFVVVLLAAAVAVAAPKKGNYLEWGESAEAYFMTPDERLEWNRVLSKDQADGFIAAYWAKRTDAFRKDITARIAAADKYFALGERPGSMTDKGRVFILLGAPTREHSIRTTSAQGGSPTGSTGTNSLERSALVVTEWTYQSDRLPKELGVPELLVRFQTDMLRGYQTIENPGLVEPYLSRVAGWHSEHGMRATTAPPAPSEIKAATGAAPAAPNAIWSSTAAMNGAYFTGDSFISPTEKPFYAYSFYLPKSVVSLAGAKDVVLVGSVRNAAGEEVANVRQPLTPAPYDESGDRYADGAVQLPPGKYSGAFGVYTADGATLLASARADFDVLDPTAARVTQPYLTSHIDTLDKQTPFDPFTFIAMKYAVKGNKTFRSSDSIGYFTFIANPVATPTPSMTMRMKVSRDGKVIDTTPTMPADLQQSGPHTYVLATRFDPNTLRPGHYALELTLRDMNAPKDSSAYKKGYVSTTEFDVK